MIVDACNIHKEQHNTKQLCDKLKSQVITLQVDDSFQYTIKINDELLHSRDDGFVRKHDDVKIYASGPFYPTLGGEIKNFKFEYLGGMYR